MRYVEVDRSEEDELRITKEEVTDAADTARNMYQLGQYDAGGLGMDRFKAVVQDMSRYLLNHWAEVEESDGRIKRIARGERWLGFWFGAAVGATGIQLLPYLLEALL